MSGDSGDALPLLSEAVRLEPANGEIRLHLALVLAAVGNDAAAHEQLAKALELDPALRNRTDVKALLGPR
jgi:Flp pilus assembly protein TadD